MPGIKMKPKMYKAKAPEKKKAWILPIARLLLAYSLILLASCAGSADSGSSRLLDFNTVTQGVSVSGVEISGMTREEALAATADIPEKLLKEITVSINVSGKLHEYSPQQLSIDTDYEEIINAAVTFGHTGSFDDRVNAARDAKEGLGAFEVTVRASEENVKAALSALEQELDVPPVEASAVFTPGGHTADGKELKPGSKAAPVRVGADSMPSPLRYKYYRTDRYIKNYIPKDASISRFVYTEEKDGLDVDIGALAGEVLNAVDTGQYMINAPVEIIKPTIMLDSVAYSTQLISSWTSSYESHDSANRNFNIAKLAGMINGVIIKPGETWSMNEQAGPRTYDNGWKGAPGILKGAFVTEPGGGVCQVSSTAFNAAIRAGLDIAEGSRHSIISNYMPVGLDATITTGGKDLKLRNPYETPVFIVSYVNTKDKNITVEVYGPPVTDETYGQVILDFSSEITDRTDMPETEKHYNAAETPDGDPIEPGKSVLFVKPRRGTTAQVYKNFISLDGKELGKKKFYTAKYPKLTGHEYINDAPPG